MLWSQTFIPTLKETPQEAESTSHRLMLRAGLVRMLMAGVYSYLPLGLKVLNNIETIIRQEMNSCQAAEVLLPALQPQELWLKSGRDKDIGEVMLRFVDRRGRKLCLGPTHEEVITELVRTHISSYKQMPLILYQIQTKFRDEIRPRFGVVRACEFIMKDAYSFDKDETGLEDSYRAMHNAYNRIFTRCGLKILTVSADPGVMGGKVSHEFMVPVDNGEDIVLLCPKCQRSEPFEAEAATTCPRCQVKLDKITAIEIGHIFQLGSKYSQTLGANFLDHQGKSRPIIMGCYGIGVSRLIAAVIEQNNDAAGIIWPTEVSPYRAIILPLDLGEAKILEKAKDIYNKLNGCGIDSLLDDRQDRAGVKFKDADLLGIPLQLVISKETLKNNTLELKLRRNNQKIISGEREVLEKTKEILNG